MAKKSSDSSFFSLLVPMAALVVTIVLISTNTNLQSKANSKRVINNPQYTYELATGWNFISPVYDRNLTARTLCNSTDNMLALATWNGESFNEYDCSNQQREDNFNLVAHKGYLLSFDSDTTINLSGKNAAPDYTLEEGWQTFGFPDSETEPLTANDLCEGFFDETSLDVKEISSWVNGGWSSHICGYQFNNFSIKKGTGYFIKAESSVSIPSKLPLLN